MKKILFLSLLLSTYQTYSVKMKKIDHEQQHKLNLALFDVVENDYPEK